MYEEEEDVPTSFAYGVGSSSLELRMRMQAYWEQQLALRNAMSLAAAGGNLNSTTQPPLTLRDYYQRFAQQYPLSLTSNQYSFPTPHIPTNVQPNSSLAPPMVTDATSPSMTSSQSRSPTKSPITAASSRRLSVSAAPYSVSNSQRNRRLSANTRAVEQPIAQLKQTPSVINATPVEYNKPQFTEDYTAQPFQSSFAPFTTQLPNHMQQYHLPDFLNQTPTIPVQSIPLDKPTAEDTSSDLFATQDWTSFLGQPQVASKIVQYDDGTNWDDYLDGDANWLLGTQPEQDS